MAQAIISVMKAFHTSRSALPVDDATDGTRLPREVELEVQSVEV